MTHVFFCVSKNVSVSCAYTQGKREQFSGFNRTLDEARAYYQLGMNDKAMKLLKALWTKSEQYLNWYLKLDGFRFRSAQTDCVRHFYIMQQVNMLGAAIDDAWASKNIEKLSSLTSIYAGKGGQFPN